MNTDNELLDQWINAIGESVERGDGQWRFETGEVPLMVLSDEQHNRMRLISPVIEAGRLEYAELRTMLEANFDRALDARYALWRDCVWAVFVSSLADLSESKFYDAVEQVANLFNNYGTTYASSDLMFDGGEEDE